MILNPYNRALIFDDEPDKIEPILNLFDTHLIPHLYINFKKAPAIKKEEEKLRNIRLVFTDFIKGNISQATPTSQLGNIINAIDTTISTKNGPMVIVIWSAHAKLLKKHFQKMLKEAGYIFELIVLNKEKYTKTPCIDSMIIDIEKQLSNIQSFVQFLNWENKIKSSSSSIIEPFTNLTEKQRKSIIKKLSKASLGNAYSISPENTLKGFYNTMTNLLYDEVEKNINYEYVNDGNAIEDDTSIADDVSYLNTRLMIDKTTLTNDNNYPGNVYIYDDFMNICEKNNEHLHRICGFDKSDLKQSIFIDSELTNIIDEDLKMVCIEISPYCDHAQQNMKKAKLVSGFILNEEQQSKTKSQSDFIYNANKNQFFLLNNEEKHFLYLSFRHIFRVDPEFVSILNPMFRLRKEMVNEIQHQTAFYLSRPGLTTLYS